MFRQEGDFAAFEKVLHETLRLDKIPNGVDRLLRRVTSGIDPKCSNINNLRSIHAKRPDGCFGNFRQADDDSSSHRPIKMVTPKILLRMKQARTRRRRSTGTCSLTMRHLGVGA
jgi:hypothetical protein